LIDGVGVSLGRKVADGAGVMVAVGIAERVLATIVAIISVSLVNGSSFLAQAANRLNNRIADIKNENFFNIFLQVYFCLNYWLFDLAPNGLRLV
jgi:hypothetical protein